MTVNMSLPQTTRMAIEVHCISLLPNKYVLLCMYETIRNTIYTPIVFQTLNTLSFYHKKHTTKKRGKRRKTKGENMMHAKALIPYPVGRGSNKSKIAQQNGTPKKQLNNDKFNK